MSPERKIIKEYYPDLETEKVDQLIEFAELLRSWNDKINLISRKDIDQLVQHHILHSLSICKHFSFVKGSRILDLGTGGGLPGIPLAIVFPDVDFHLIDARSKKIMVVNEIIDSLKLKNAKAEHKRVEELKAQFDFIVSRAVTDLATLRNWTKKNFDSKNLNSNPNGLIVLKGGDIKKIQSELPRYEYIEHYPIEEIYNFEYYKEKYILYIQA